MKEQILAKLVIKFPGLSKAFLGLLATQMAKKVTEESGIDAAITELDNAPIPIAELAADFQREGDRRVTDAKKEWDKKNPPKPSEKTDPPAPEKDPPTADDTPAWAKTLMQEIANLKADKVKGSMQSRLKEKLKDVPEKFYAKRALPEKEEEFDAFADEIQADWNELKDAKVVADLATGTKPQNGSANEQASKAISPEVKAFVEKQKAIDAKAVVTK